LTWPSPAAGITTQLAGKLPADGCARAPIAAVPGAERGAIARKAFATPSNYVKPMDTGMPMTHAGIRHRPQMREIAWQID
jgi:hypothetical protein